MRKHRNGVLTVRSRNLTHRVPIRHNRQQCSRTEHLIAIQSVRAGFEMPDGTKLPGIRFVRFGL